MPRALGQSAEIRERSGKLSAGSPEGIGPTSFTPSDVRSNTNERRIPNATATNAPGKRLERRGNKIKIPSVTAEITVVAKLI